MFFQSFRNTFLPRMLILFQVIHYALNQEDLVKVWLYGLVDLNFLSKSVYSILFVMPLLFFDEMDTKSDWIINAVRPAKPFYRSYLKPIQILHNKFITKSLETSSVSIIVISFNSLRILITILCLFFTLGFDLESNWICLFIDLYAFWTSSHKVSSALP